MEYLVDIIMPVYNHEKYISQAIEGVLNQKADFRFRLLIGEDCSKDNSRDIIAQYAEKYPGIIFPVFHEKNMGATTNVHYLYSLVTAKYTATCEGDDYWTDPCKLQKQVDFLEANPDFTMCFTSVAIKDEMNWNKPDEWYFPALNKDVFSIEDTIMAEMNMMPTPTLLFRSVYPNPMPEFFKRCISGDIIMQLLLADKGKAKFLNEKTAVYRNHGGGITKSKDAQQRGDRQLREAFAHVNEYLDHRHDKLFRRRFFQMAKVSLIYCARDKKGLQRVTHYFREFPKYLKYSDKINIKEVVYYHIVLFFPFLLRKAKQQGIGQTPTVTGR